MRYPADQKAETHKQIVDIAAREFRSKGLQGIGISNLMSQVGLTHGGFYAHFKDRDALVEEAAVCAANHGFQQLMAAAQAAKPGKEVAAMLDYYLSPAHRDEPGFGCVLPALAAEIAGQADSVRDAFTQAAKQNLNQMARYMPGASEKSRLTQAMVLLSSMAGGVLVARAVNDPKLSKLLLDSVRTQLLHLYGTWLD
ncbi:transcriptional regulator, TetR family [Rhodoferax ferrireducens T118]|uniref:Transcriptional regulator, TetR family n=1 Tax=Albidiferax ferrireducens (strain ATCC BAA-621 / DSM 15236 / T118) TaxID=338969 RepID=Q21XK8_ALBFT|nr:TetR/AcrR family transcriptional regulator [Rhodoferax ferrireducens]ABD69495.1 transcriptional regulator, TetR family [Rhodoferax ferrireducens T118]WPC68620.1 TetR/AcrR family transcriptional regulator [Rhodoferax ferrireducens]